MDLKGENFPILIRVRSILYPCFKKASFMLYKMRFSMSGYIFFEGAL